MLRSLVLTCHLPFPPYSGGRRREYELLLRMVEKHDVRFDLCVVTKTLEHDLDHLPALRPYCESVTVLPARPQDSGGARQPPLWRARQSLRHASLEAPRRVGALVREHDFDLCHVEGFYLMQHLGLMPDVPVLLVEQNIEYLLQEQRSRVATDPAERAHQNRQYFLTRAEEERAWRASDVCAAVTSEDRRHIASVRGARWVELVPDGCDHSLTLDEAASGASAEPCPVTNGRPCVLFVANFEYEPNVDAALFLIREIAPSIVARKPEVEFLLVGNGPPREVRALDELDHIRVSGRVLELDSILASAQVVVCPLRIGGGIKVKILEALRAGKAIVTTSLGVRGLGPGACGVLRVEDDPVAFADQVVKLLDLPEERRRLEAAATAFARSLPTWDDAANDLARCYAEAAAARRTSRRRAKLAAESL